MWCNGCGARVERFRAGEYGSLNLPCGCEDVGISARRPDAAVAVEEMRA